VGTAPRFIFVIYLEMPSTGKVILYGDKQASAKGKITLFLFLGIMLRKFQV
jgi:hypothetical protein